MKITLFIFLLLMNCLLGPYSLATTKCVQIFYDQTDSESYWIGRLYATFTQNLLGHFPHIQQKIIPIESYTKNQIERCHANIYLGSFYENNIPNDFILDFISTKKNSAWLGYGLNKWDKNSLHKIFSSEFIGFSTLDAKNKDKNGDPGFYKYFSYKGEEFYKYHSWSFINETDKEKTFTAPYEISLLKLSPQVNPNLEVLSWSTHSVTHKKHPYILRNKNHWYFADIPFSFMHEEDRYLIFTDLLFDILDENPIRTDQEKPAFIRIEDIHPLMDTWLIEPLFQLFEKLSIPYSISIIPIFSDPFGLYAYRTPQRITPLHHSHRLLESLHRAKDKGADFIFHGVTHQYGSTPNPFNAVSGVDFEFWDINKNAPIAEDSIDYVLSRLEDGWDTLQRSNITPIAWLTPHYQASALDYILFGHVFEWNIGRMIYFPITKIQKAKNFNSIFKFTNTQSLSPEISKKRRDALNEVHVHTLDGIGPNGQFFPYEIYGDVYGQKIIPENLGNMQPYINHHVTHKRSVDDLLRIAKKMLVIRDSWGSFFIHPFMVYSKNESGTGNWNGDTKEIERLLIELKKMGYQFFNLSTLIKKYNRPLRTEAIEIKKLNNKVKQPYTTLKRTPHD